MPAPTMPAATTRSMPAFDACLWQAASDRLRLIKNVGHVAVRWRGGDAECIQLGSQQFGSSIHLDPKQLISGLTSGSEGSRLKKWRRSRISEEVV
jgi:hypothetical protein